MDPIIATEENRSHAQPVDKDRELVRFVGRHGLVRIEHLMTAMGVGRTAAYRRVAFCVDGGLLEGVEIVRSEPRLLRATRDGLRYAGLGLPPFLVSLGGVDHALRCASTAQLLAAEFGVDTILTERELRDARPLASAKFGQLPSGRPRLHRPDLAVIAPGGVIAIEVELTAKAPRRLLGIVRAWRGAEWISEVRYYCPPGAVRRGVEAAVAKTYAEKKISVFQVVPR